MAKTRWGWRAALLLVTVVCAAVSIPTLAVAVPPGMIGSFPTFSMVASTTPGLSYEGTANFSLSVGSPVVTIATDSATVRTPTGESAFLGASTGFGQHFGSSRSQPYLYLSPAAGGPSTTTITFDGPPPVGWGFAVGDIDADFLQVVPRDELGNQLAGAALNAQDTGGTPLLNYCNNVPKPSSCAGPGPFTDFPLWYENGATVEGTAYPNPIVEGQGSDTSGAYDWFLPSPTVRSIDLIFTVKSGFPIYQLWLAAPAPASTIGGTIVTEDSTPIPPDVTVELENPDGTPVLDIEEQPVGTGLQPDGSFEFQTEQGQYELSFTVPPGYDPIPTIPVDATTAVVDLGTITIAPTAVDPGPAELPPTGPDLQGPLVAAGIVTSIGTLLLVTVRRRSLATRRK